MLRKFVLLWLCLSGAIMVFAASTSKFTLVIDAGHGGKDAGACSKTAKEKDINLGVALAFGRYVERNCPDVRVIYTRKTDVFIPLHERAAIANRNKADVFISIHTNSLASKKPITGMETYTMGMRRSDEKLSAAKRENEVILIEQDYKQHYSGYDPRSPESMLIFDIINEKNMAESVELARLIQQHTCSTARRPNKGVKQDAFLVLRETSMPACLVELGYITTPADEAYLTNKTNVDLLGRGIYQAFVAYKNKRTGKAVATVSAGKSSSQTTKVAQSGKKEEQEDTVNDSKVANEVMEMPLQAATAGEAPIFKIQLMTSDRKLSANDRQLKGLTGVEMFKEGVLWKYTIGASSDYNEIYTLRKKVLEKFPQAFIIAFKNGEKVDVNAAIREFKDRNNRKQ